MGWKWIKVPEKIHHKIKLIANIEKRQMQEIVTKVLEKFISDWEKQRGINLEEMLQ